jgi:hypothetical protein
MLKKNFGMELVLLRGKNEIAGSSAGRSEDAAVPTPTHARAPTQKKKGKGRGRANRNDDDEDESEEEEVLPNGTSGGATAQNSHKGV